MYQLCKNGTPYANIRLLNLCNIYIIAYMLKDVKQQKGNFVRETEVNIMDEKFGIVRYDRWDHAYYVYCPYCMSKDVLEDKNAAGSQIGRAHV